MNIKTVIRIYLSDGVIDYNDEVINKAVRINYQQRSRLQVLFLFLFLLVFSSRMYLGQSFELVAKIVTILYLIIDLYLISTKVKIEELNVNLKNYSDFKILERVKGRFIGGLNIMLLFLLFME